MNKKMKMESLDVMSKNIDKIAQIFPNCITETPDTLRGGYTRSVDFDKLKKMLVFEDGEVEEKYEMTWVGKTEAIREANKSIRKTLRPYKEESVDWNNTKNIYIEGDNLEVLKLLQESYLEAVDIMYIDPPYNTGKDFIYRDNFRIDKDEYENLLGQMDENGERLFLNSDSYGRFHSDWCSMMYSRLLVARNLLSERGVIFISIDDNENADLVKICNEVFGEACFVCSAIWRSSDNSNNDAKQFSNDHNYTLIYSKKPMWQPEKIQDESKRGHFKNPDNDPKGPWFDGNPLNSPNYRENLRYTITAPNGNVIEPPKNGWRWSEETLKEKMVSGEIYFNEQQTNIKRRTYLCDMEGLPPSSLWVDLDKTGHNRQAKYELLDLMPEDVFDTPKPVKLIKYIMSLVPDNKNALIMDFFSGSGTTADAIMQMNAKDGGNRKFILVQLPENLDEGLEKASNDKKQRLRNAIKLCDDNHVRHALSEVSKERIRRAAKKIKDEINDNSLKIDLGFRVFKVDDSNMNDIYYSADRYSQGMIAAMESNIKPDRTDLDLLFGCVLDWGLPLSLPYTSEEISGVKVHTYNDGDLIACFDENVPEDVVREIAKRQPLRAVFRDSSFSNSPAKINVGEIFKAIAPDTNVKVI